MMRGVLMLLKGRRLCIIEQDAGARWRRSLALGEHEGELLTEKSGSLATMRPPKHGQFLFVVGADMLDGTCGVAPALQRLRFAERALANGATVIINCSFRPDADPRLVAAWKRLCGALILLRDELSRANFSAQVGLPCDHAPDLSLHAAWVDNGHCAPQKMAAPVIALNMSEQAFRSLNTEHSSRQRETFTRELARRVHGLAPGAHFLLMSNDTRNWPNHPSDDEYSAMLHDQLVQLATKRQVTVQGADAGYFANAAALKSAQVLVTGRMHLALAAARVGCEPIILMGQSQSYSSVQKMRGMMRYCGLDDSQVALSVDQLMVKLQLSLKDPDMARSRLREFNLRAGQDTASALEMIRKCIATPKSKPGWRQRLFAQTGMRLHRAPVDALA